MPDGRSASPEDDLRALLAARCGKTLDQRWTLERLLGVGGMSAVYEARHRNGRRVALKVLHPTLSLLPAARTRFLREGFLANRAAHPGLVQVLDEGATGDGETYLVMEYLEGETLEQRVARAGVLPVDEALGVASALLDALSTAHAAGLVHRDIKPANVMRLPDGGVKLLDFGIARLAESGTATQHGATRGTPAFMAPEQARGETDAIDARTDLWAVGALLFYLLSARLVRDATNPEALIFEAATRPARSLARLCPALPAAVTALVDRALSFDRAARFADAPAMRAAVDALREPAASVPGEPIAPPLLAPVASRPSSSAPSPRPSSSAPPARPSPAPSTLTTASTLDATAPALASGPGAGTQSTLDAVVPPSSFDTAASPPSLGAAQASPSGLASPAPASPARRPPVALVAGALALAVALPLSWSAWPRPPATLPAPGSARAPASPALPAASAAGAASSSLAASASPPPAGDAPPGAGSTGRAAPAAAATAPGSRRGRDARPPAQSPATAASASPPPAAAEGAPLSLEEALKPRR